MSALFDKAAPIAMVAPCGIHDPARLQRGVDLIRARGYTIEPFGELLRPLRYLAADDDHRAEQLAAALASPDHPAVWITRGGYGLTRILHRIDPEVVAAGKVVIGFSDVTALHCALHPYGRATLVHGPVVHSLPITDAASVDHLFALLGGEPTAPLSGQPWVAGEARGWLCGGNLTLLAALCGTPWQLDATGAIVVIEEIGEAAYKIDRYLQQLLSAGFFDEVAGIAIGQLEGCATPEGADWSLRDVFEDLLGPLGIPILGDLPIGHGAANRAFPYGAPAHLSGSTLTF